MDTVQIQDMLKSKSNNEPLALSLLSSPDHAPSIAPLWAGLLPKKFEHHSGDIGDVVSRSSICLRPPRLLLGSQLKKFVIS